MSLDFGPKAMAGAFLLLLPPAPAPPNPWKQTTTKYQLALRDERSTVSMTDNSYTTSLASLQSDMASMLTSIVTLNDKQHTEDRKLYEDRAADCKAQRKIVDDKRDAERGDDL